MERDNQVLASSGAFSGIKRNWHLPGTFLMHDKKNEHESILRAELATMIKPDGRHQIDL
jgi:hypothetical protein